MSSGYLSHFFLTGAAACALGVQLQAQVPDGFFVASSYRRPSSPGWPGAGGIFFGHPVNPGAVVPVTNLPPEVTGTAWPSATRAGAQFVVRRPSDGALVSNGLWDPNYNSSAPHWLYVLSLAGSVVTQSTPIFVGTVTDYDPTWGLGTGVPQAVMLHDERLAIAWSGGGLAGEPLINTPLGIVDLVQGTVSAVPVSGVPTGPSPWINALAVDTQRGVAYLGYEDGWNAWIYSVPFPAGGTSTLLATLPSPSYVSSLAVDNGGKVVAAGPGLYSINPSNGSQTRIPTSLSGVNAVAVERATGDLLVASHTTGRAYEVYRVVLPSGATTRIGLSPTGALSGIDLNPDPEVYGAASGMSPLQVNWSLAPNPGGLPTVGNGNFGLQLTASSQPLFTGVLLGFAPFPAPQPVPSLQILVQPVTQELLGVPLTLSLPIPPNPGLAGLQVFAQGVFIDGAGVLGATAGVHLTVL